MPRKDIDYSKTHVYKITSKDLDMTDCLVNYTTDFRRRQSMHSRNSLQNIKPGPHAKLYNFIQNNGGWDKFEMLLIITRPCDSALYAKRFGR